MEIILRSMIKKVLIDRDRQVLSLIILILSLKIDPEQCLHKVFEIKNPCLSQQVLRNRPKLLMS